MGEVISFLLRNAVPSDPGEAAQVNGFEIMPPAGRTISAALVQQMIDETDAA